MRCPKCDGRLIWRRETASAPNHYECSSCHRIYDAGGKPWKPIVQGRDIRGA